MTTKRHRSPGFEDPVFGDVRPGNKSVLLKSSTLFDPFCLLVFRSIPFVSPVADHVQQIKRGESNEETSQRQEAEAGNKEEASKEKRR